MSTADKDPPASDVSSPDELDRSPALSGGPPRHHTYDDLDLSRCYQLLAAHSVGRVAWSAADGPQLFPVSYVWMDEFILFPTSAYGILSELVRRTPVVFEVDEVDPSRRRGWSVIIRGRAAGVASRDAFGGSSGLPARPWASGTRHLIIAITPEFVTGRSFHPVEDDDQFPSSVDHSQPNGSPLAC